MYLSHLYPIRHAGGWLCLLALTMLAGNAGAAEKLRIAMSMTPLSAPLIVAEEKGFFREQDLDVSIEEVIGGHRTLKLVFEGKADIATSSDAVVMFNSFERDDFVVIASFVNSDSDVKIITHADSGIKTVADLKGRKVGTTIGAASHFFLSQNLLLNQVPPDSVTLVDIQPEQAPEKLAGGEVDAVVVWEPWGYNTRQHLGEEAFVVPHEKSYTETFNALALREFAVAHQAELRGFLRALQQAAEFIQQHPAAARNMVARRLKQDKAFLQAVWHHFEFSLNLHQWLITTLETEARWATEQGHVKGGKIPNYLDFMFIAPLEAVNPNAVTIFR